MRMYRIYTFFFLLSRTMQPDDCSGQQARLDLRDDIKTIYSYTRTHTGTPVCKSLSHTSADGGGEGVIYKFMCDTHESNGRSGDDAATKLSRRRVSSAPRARGRTMASFFLPPTRRWTLCPVGASL